MPTDDEIEYLLSRGGLGPGQRERALSGIREAARFEARRRGRLGWKRTSALVSAAAAAAIVMFVMVRSPSDDPGLRTKGGSSPAPALDVVCLRASLRACPRGSLLAFSVHGSDGPAFVTAFAEPTSPGERIWYLENERAPTALDAGVGVLATGARVGPEHRPGSYRVQLLLTRRPISRAEVTKDKLGSDLVSKSVSELVIAP